MPRKDLSVYRVPRLADFEIRLSLIKLYNGYLQGRKVEKKKGKGNDSIIARKTEFHFNEN